MARSNRTIMKLPQDLRRWLLVAISIGALGCVQAPQRAVSADPEPPRAEIRDPKPAPVVSKSIAEGPEERPDTAAEERTEAELPSTQIVATEVPSSSEKAAVESAESSGEVYRLRPHDRLAVVFPYEPSLDEEVVVRPDGQISLPWLPPFEVAGMSPEELENLLRRELAGVMKNPEPRVVVRSIGPRFVTVLGAVQRPGLVDLRSAPNLAAAVAAAGGVSEEANPYEILRIRPAELAGGRVLEADLQDPAELAHNDVVYVPMSVVSHEADRAALKMTAHKGETQ